MKKGGRYDVSHLEEAQFEPGSRSRVLKNRLGIKSKREMEAAESLALKDTLDKLLTMYDAGHRFTASDIKAMHKTWLGDIYGWAGEYRQVNVSKGDFNFASARQIPLLMSEFEKGTLRKHTPCKFKTPEKVVQALAEVHVELVLIHPFREGNGRVARLLSTVMASQAGLPIIDFSEISGRRQKEYFAAINSGLRRDYELMEKHFRIIIDKAKKTKSGEDSGTSFSGVQE
ncbi:cell filamentation protein Fic [candidate division WS5 bacterium]|uniref:Cell filamentation protein Fic n=1 Tax=candidate division WS5 bacterium TaxID=2093353 RepID=A0A419DDX1_9BACT|nr:MAG: cell filamentation protein Fic [candidate division WS5 bacterium]